MLALLPNNRLARFIFARNHYRADGTVKYQAFLPASDGDTSVFSISELTRDQIWELAEAHVVPLRLMPVKGSAEIEVSHVLDTGLSVALSEPPPLHANISGWPGGANPTDEDRARKKQIAQKLEEVATLNLK